MRFRTTIPAALGLLFALVGLAHAGELPQAKGTLSVYCEQAVAIVRIDGEGVGQTPFEHFTLEPGRYLVTASASGFITFSQTVEVKPLQETRVVARLKELLPGQIDPGDALAMRSFLKKRAIAFTEGRNPQEPLEGAPSWLQQGTNASGNGNARLYTGVGIAKLRISSQWEDRLFACVLYGLAEVQKTLDGEAGLSTRIDEQGSMKIQTQHRWGKPPFTLTYVKKSYEPSAENAQDPEFIETTMTVEGAPAELGAPRWMLRYESTQDPNESQPKEELTWKPDAPHFDGARLSRALQHLQTSGLRLHAVHFTAGTTYCLLQGTLGDLHKTAERPH